MISWSIFRLSIIIKKSFETFNNLVKKWPYFKNALNDSKIVKNPPNKLMKMKNNEKKLKIMIKTLEYVKIK